MKQIQLQQRSPRPATNRRGSTLVIVVALLGMLAFLGFVFYTFAKQERVNAVSFSQSAKNTKTFNVDADAIIDFGLEQILIGPSDSNFQSILWGGRHSILANMFGTDYLPFNGEGVNLISVTGQPHVDMNYDGIADDDAFLNFVDSPVANNGMLWGTGKSLTGLPAPDTNYNSPNIDTIFLSYDGVALDSSLNPKRVIIPSFFRPQYLRANGAVNGTVHIEDLNQNGQLDAGEDQNANGVLDDWYQAPAYASQIMRPHPSHICVDSNGNPILSNGNNILRYVQSSDTPSNPGYKNLGLRRPFTSIVNSATYPNAPGSFAPPESTANTITTGSLGVWTPQATGNPVVPLDIDLDVDTDGDGVMDAILMDLGYPPIRRGDGKLVVPLFAISIRDLNGLLNINANGNAAGTLNLGTLSSTDQLGFRVTGAGTFSPDNLSKSNLGVSPYEVNVQRALTADPTYNTGAGVYNDPQLVDSEAAVQLSKFLNLFDGTVSTGVTSPPQPGRSVAELSNLEWLLLNIGRVSFHSFGTNTLIPGRNGETSLLNALATSLTFATVPNAGLSVNWNAGLPTNWPPAPTNPNPDDNSNYNEGESSYNIRYSTPIDFKGSGQRFQRYNWGPDGQPGQAGVDDDHDGFVDNFTEEGWVGTDDIVTTPLYGKVPELLQLTSNIALGSASSAAATKYSLYWPAYSGYQTYNGNANGGVRWGEYQSTPNYFFPLGIAGSSLLMRGSSRYSLLDDPTEMILDKTLVSPSYSSFLNALTSNTLSNPLTTTEVGNVTSAAQNDSTLGLEETLFLQGSPSDVQLSNVRSRLSQLMPGNLVASQNAGDIRKRLTPISQDRREFGLVNSTVGNTVANNAGSASTMRFWESSVNGFPPFSNGAGVSVPNPYRAELYYYLQQPGSIPSLTPTLSTSLKLDVNRWLFLDAVTNKYAFAALPEQTSVTDANATTARQNMARDIYTLLYTLCCVHGTSPTAVDLDYRSGPPPSRAQAKEMAQFAINLVDALDTDSIITAFYYDPDLSNNSVASNLPGWDSNAFIGPDATPQTADDYVVYGVERQQLVISEAAIFSVQAVGADTPVTIFNDVTGGTNGTAATGRKYMFFELQNVSPMNVTLAPAGTTWQTVQPNFTTHPYSNGNANWRVSLRDPTVIDPATALAKVVNQLYFLPGLDSTNNYVTHTAGSDLVLPSGAVFTVSSQDGTDIYAGNPRTSDFRYSADSGATYPLAVPKTPPTGITDTPPTPTTAPTTANNFVPRCNLDLVWTNGTATSYGDATPLRFWQSVNSSTSTGFPNPLPGGAFIAPLASLANQVTAQLTLETQVAAGANPNVATYPNWVPSIWVPVDSTTNKSISATNPEISVVSIAPATAAVTSPVSYPRSVPLLSCTAPTVASANAINTASISNFTVANSIPFQLQNDRDFASLGELLQLPLYGADQLTSALAQVNTPGSATIAPTISNGLFYELKVGGTPTYFPSIAAARFLRTDNPDYTLNGTANNFGNRWYRLFDFLEVPNRSHQHQAIVGIPPVVSVSPSAQTVSFGIATTAGTPVTFVNQPGGTAPVPGATSYSPYDVSTRASSTLISGPFNFPEYYGWPTTNGQINLNMIRHPQVLNALLDDDQLIYDPRYYQATPPAGWPTPPSAFTSAVNGNPYATSPVNYNYISTLLYSMDPNDSARIWWYEFLKSRDSRYNSSTPFAVDPVTNLYVPGTANARPFRGFDSVGTIPASTTDSPIEDTIFRSLPLDAVAGTTPNQSRRLFEVGNTTADFFNTVQTEIAGTPIHPSARHQLLSKVMNNTTTRTNSYAVFVAVQYYEAVEVSGTSALGNVTAVRIGGQLTDIPTNRAFFVIDRTGAIDQMKELVDNANYTPIPNGAAQYYIPPYMPATEYGAYPFTTFPLSANSFRFRANSDTTGLRNNVNGIRWRDLVLYRQTLN